MADSITVYYNGDAMTVYKSVAERQKIRHGQSIDEKKFWEVIHANASHGLSLCEAATHPKN